MTKRPKKTKYIKYQKGRIRYNMPIKKSEKEKTLLRGEWQQESKKERVEEKKRENSSEKKNEYILMACEPTKFTAGQIYAGELAIKRYLKNANDKGEIKGKLIIEAFPHIPVTKKPAEVRMGKGKGSIDYWMTRIKYGSKLYKIRFNNIKTLADVERSKNIANNAFKIANSKLPIKTIIIHN